MQNIKHVVEHKYKASFRNEKVKGMFDLKIEEKLRKEWDVALPIDEKEWSIGLIIGASGSGKTTLANKIFGDKIYNGFSWDNTKSILDNFPESASIEAIVEMITKVGFSSPPQWLLPYSALSNGQKFRVELARCLFEYNDLFVFDEFTSVVDRTVAQIGSFAFQKVLRKTNKKFVAVTCHYDVEEWLQPDWVFDVSKNEFRWRNARRPEINIEIRRVKWNYWKYFKNYHYLSGEINKSSICFCAFINNRPVAFSSWISHFGSQGARKIKRAHRTVVIPDFQGIGIGNILSNYCASLFSALNFKVISTSSHPGFVKKRIASKNWVLHRLGIVKAYKLDKAAATRSLNRLSAGFEYIGKIENIDISKEFIQNNSK